MAGIAGNVLDHTMPINFLRHPWEGIMPSQGPTEGRLDKTLQKVEVRMNWAMRNKRIIIYLMICAPAMTEIVAITDNNFGDTRQLLSNGCQVQQVIDHATDDRFPEIREIAGESHDGSDSRRYVTQ